MSDFQLVALIAVFLVLSGIIVWILGGDAKSTDTVATSPEPQPDAHHQRPEVPVASHLHAPVQNVAPQGPVASESHLPTSPTGSVDQQLVDIELQRPSSRPSPVAPTSTGTKPSLGPIQHTRPNVQATLHPGSSNTRGSSAPAAPRQSAPLTAEEKARYDTFLKPDVAHTRPRPEIPMHIKPPATTSRPPIEPCAPSVEGTLEPGVPPRKPALQPQFARAPLTPQEHETFVSFARPDTDATIYRPSAAAEAASSPQAERAESLPPSDAVQRPTASAAPPAQAASEPEAILLSTAKRGTRVVGANASEPDILDIEPVTPPRPQTPSIWSRNYPRPSVAHTIAGGIDILGVVPGVRAERIPVRAETILVGKQPGDDSGIRSTGAAANVRYTLPPGALGNE